MYVCQHWGTAQLVFSWCWAHRTDSIKLVNIRAGLRCTVPPPPPVPPVHQPRSRAQPCSRMKNISADTCSRQSQAGGVLSTYLLSTYLYIYSLHTRESIHASRVCHLLLWFKICHLNIWKESNFPTHTLNINPNKRRFSSCMDTTLPGSLSPLFREVHEVNIIKSSQISSIKYFIYLHPLTQSPSKW